jgi:hypothetical protein
MEKSIPLTTFEEFMLVDERPAYPMCCFLRLSFSGLFDRTVLEISFRNALRWHPLLTSRVCRGSNDRLEWVPVIGGPSPILWTVPIPGKAYPPFDRIDITAECGLRLAVVEDQENCDLIMYVHHACIDGLGMIQFMEELFSEYALTSGITFTRPVTERAGLEALLQRGVFGMTRSQFARMLPKQLIGYDRMLKFLLHQPLPLAPGKPLSWTAELPEDYPSVVTRSLAESELIYVREAAGRNGVTVNEILVRDLFIALDQWWHLHYPATKSGWFRVGIPINLRPFSAKVIPAANVMSVVFLDRKKKDMTNPQKLLVDVHLEMEHIKLKKLGLVFPMSLSLARKLPGGISYWAKADRCQNTCSFSNLGAPLDRLASLNGSCQLEIGNLRLENIEILPPLRPYTFASFSAIVYAGRMFLALHYDSRVLSVSQMESLADLFMGQVLRQQ